MASQVRTPTTAVNGAGSIAWTNPTNALTSDDTYATVTLGPGADSQDLETTGYGFSIPAGATIDGIIVYIEGNETGAGVGILGDVRVIRAGVGGGVEGKTDVLGVGTDVVVQFGSNVDTWSESWTPSDINNSGFGCWAEALNTAGAGNSTSSIDSISMEVFYTVSTPGSVMGSRVSMGARWNG